MAQKLGVLEQVRNWRVGEESKGISMRKGRQMALLLESPEY
jgi:hypothetical protein